MEAAQEARQHAAVAAVLDLLGGAKRLHVSVFRNAKRIGEVDKRRNGVFLFNHFLASDQNSAEGVEVLLGVWEYTAGWFTTKTGLDNSTLMRPVDGADSDFGVINHCRWDRLLDIMPHLMARPSLRRFVLANFTANGIVAMPVLYRLAG